MPKPVGMPIHKSMQDLDLQRKVTNSACMLLVSLLSANALLLNCPPFFLLLCLATALLWP